MVQLSLGIKRTIFNKIDSLGNFYGKYYGDFFLMMA